jgi:hypothetical protein
MLRTWRTSHPLATGIRAQDLKVDMTSIFAPASGDASIAEAAEGPVIVARDLGPSARIVVIGFHPMRLPIRYELTIPLVFANALRWMAPASFHRQELYAETVGSVTAPLESDPATGLQVVAADGSDLPFTIQGSMLRFFSGRPGTVRVIAPGSEQVHSLVLPDVPESVWQPPASARRGLPRVGTSAALSRDIWHWLALAGGLGLLLEWLWFAPSGAGRFGSAPSTRRRVVASNPEEEPVRRAS